MSMFYVIIKTLENEEECLFILSIYTPILPIDYSDLLLITSKNGDAYSMKILLNIVNNNPNKLREMTASKYVNYSI